MNKRWLLILLLISAAFNLAVLGSFVYLRGFHPRHHHSPRHEWRDNDRWPGRFHKGPAPEFAFGDSIRALRQGFEDTKRELMLELAKDPLDMPQIEAIITRSLNAQVALERDMADRLIRFRNTLTPEEAREHFSRRAEDMQRRDNDNRKYKKSRRSRR